MSPIHADLSTYMPMRDEFETEWDNDCENKIKELAFEEDDTPEDISMKMKILEIHNYRLQCRKKYRDFVVSRNLHDIKEQQRLARARSKEQREVHKSLKRFTQILSPKEYEEFIAGIAKERQLKQRIKQLQNYRRKGICTLDEITEYEEEKKLKAVDRTRDKPKKGPSVNKLQHLDISNQPGIELLSDQERELCEHSHLLPNDYMVIKEGILRDYVKAGELPLQKIEQMGDSISSLDMAKIKAVFEFLHQVGWINNRNHTTVSQNLPGSKKPKSPLMAS
jgi:transcriptional adapter 2-alpha